METISSFQRLWSRTTARGTMSATAAAEVIARTAAVRRSTFTRTCLCSVTLGPPWNDALTVPSQNECSGRLQPDRHAVDRIGADTGRLAEKCHSPPVVDRANVERCGESKDDRPHGSVGPRV